MSFQTVEIENVEKLAEGTPQGPRNTFYQDWRTNKFLSEKYSDGHEQLHFKFINYDESTAQYCSIAGATYEGWLPGQLHTVDNPDMRIECCEYGFHASEKWQQAKKHALSRYILLAKMRGETHVGSDKLASSQMYVHSIVYLGSDFLQAFRERVWLEQSGMYTNLDEEWEFAKKLEEAKHELGTLAHVFNLIIGIPEIEDIFTDMCLSGTYDIKAVDEKERRRQNLRNRLNEQQIKLSALYDEVERAVNAVYSLQNNVLTLVRESAKTGSMIDSIL